MGYLGENQSFPHPISGGESNNSFLKYFNRENFPRALTLVSRGGCGLLDAPLPPPAKKSPLLPGGPAFKTKKARSAGKKSPQSAVTKGHSLGRIYGVPTVTAPGFSKPKTKRGKPPNQGLPVRALR